MNGDIVLVVDVKATCEENEFPDDKRGEIIEIGICAFDLALIQYFEYKRLPQNIIRRGRRGRSPPTHSVRGSADESKNTITGKPMTSRRNVK
jgi:hypothetical protein